MGVGSQQGSSQLPVSLLSMFLCPLGESDKDLPSAWYSLSCQTGENRSGCKLCLPAGFPCIPCPLQPSAHTQLNVCLLKSQYPCSKSVPPPSIRSSALSNCNNCSVLQDRDQSMQWFTGRPYCFTASLTEPPDPDAHRDVSPGWLARSPRSCLSTG